MAEDLLLAQNDGQQFEELLILNEFINCLMAGLALLEAVVGVLELLNNHGLALATLNTYILVFHRLSLFFVRFSGHNLNKELM